jgi:hypothetical protein
MGTGRHKAKDGAPKYRAKATSKVQAEALLKRVLDFNLIIAVLRRTVW